MSENNKAIVLQKEVSPVVERAGKLKIVDRKTMLLSVEMLSQLNKFVDMAKKEKETITKPAREIIKRENARWEGVIKPAEESISLLRAEQSRYQTETDRKVKEAEEKLMSRVKPGKGNLSPGAGIARIAELERTDEVVETDSGSIKFRDHQQLKVTDINIIPRHYFILDEARLLRDLKAGEVVIGAEIEVVKISVNNRK
jgi:hypothetical protein